MFLHPLGEGFKTRGIFILKTPGYILVPSYGLGNCFVFEHFFTVLYLTHAGQDVGMPSVRPNMQRRSQHYGNG